MLTPDQEILQKNALLQIKNFYPTQTAMAEALGVRQSAVSCWLSGGKQPSPLHTKLIEQLHGIPRHVIRPDIYGY